MIFPFASFSLMASKSNLFFKYQAFGILYALEKESNMTRCIKQAVIIMES